MQNKSSFKLRVCAAMFSIMAFATLTGCTEQTRARNFGGSATIDLPVGHKLVNVAWRESDMWTLTRPMRDGETAERYVFVEHSTYGLVEGRVVLQERK